MALLNKRLRDMMDFRIFVDCDSDERLIRNIQRDIIERGRTVQMVVDRYLNQREETTRRAFRWSADTSRAS